MEKKFSINDLGNQYHLRKSIANIIFILPIIILVVGILLLVIPFTRKFGFWLLEENKPIEILTFIFFLLGGVFGITGVVKCYKILDIRSAIFFFIFAFFLLIIAMEEIAWGQWFFHFETPSAWKEINVQGETTLHNLEGWDGIGILLRFIFGLGGIIGIMLNKSNLFNSIAVPELIIMWFLAIIFHNMIDFMEETGMISGDLLHEIIRRTKELVEFLIAASSLLYLILKFRLFSLTKLKS